LQADLESAQILLGLGLYLAFFGHKNRCAGIGVGNGICLGEAFGGDVQA
jgi:hypothetical protein